MKKFILYSLILSLSVITTHAYVGNFNIVNKTGQPISMDYTVHNDLLIQIAQI